MSGLLSPELLANIGKTSAPRLELVTRKDIRKYAIATQQRERRFLDGDEAPPMFYLALFWPVPENDQLSPDGVAIDPLLPEFPLKRAMAGGLHIDYHRSIHPGDVLQATRAMLDARPELAGAGAAITEADLAPHLAMSFAPEPDLFIRTGGEQRISNFLLWQLAYTELYFTDSFWPDFGAVELDKAFESYRSRERRFGRTSAQVDMPTNAPDS